MQKFGDFFHEYIDVSQFPEPVREGTIASLQIDSGIRALTASVLFPSLVERDILDGVERSIISCKPLRLSKACVKPTFPQASFSVGYYPSLVMELKRREASLNGTFTDSEATLENGCLLIQLKHGGGEFLKARHVDRMLADLIREEFGLSLKVEFGGVLAAEPGATAFKIGRASCRERV